MGKADCKQELDLTLYLCERRTGAIVQPLKDQFFNKTYVTTLAADIQTGSPAFGATAFVASVLNRQWKSMELKERMHHVADCLHAALARNYKTCIRLLTPIVQNRIREGRTSFGDMIFPDFVERFGIEDFKTSVRALEIFTLACSSEFAVRPFIVRYGDKMMQQMLVWSKHKNEHVRRLASEGCRPRLPWGMSLLEFKKDPQPVLQILENLKSDTSEYVRRSVANNLNDISKDNLEIALATAERWLREDKESAALIRHALRNELKKGNPRALKLFALAQKTKASISGLRVTPQKIRIGEAVHFEFTLQTVHSERLRLEYWVHFVKASGGVSKKVFQIAERDFAAATKQAFKKKHRFQDFTTRKHYAGSHRIAIAVNGNKKAETQIILN